MRTRVTVRDAHAGRLVYRFSEVCSLLGVNEHVLRQFMRRERDPIPFIRSRGLVLFPKDAVRRWVDSAGRPGADQDAELDVDVASVSRARRSVRAGTRRQAI